MANAKKSKSNVIPFPSRNQSVFYKQYIKKADSIPMFKLMDRSDLEYIFEHSKFHDLPAGTLIIKQGAIGKSLFILLSGNAAALRKKKNNTQIYLDKYKQGDIFGERAFFGDSIRNCSIYSTTRLKLLETKNSELKKLTDRCPQIHDFLFSIFEEYKEKYGVMLKNYFNQLRSEDRKPFEGKVRFKFAGHKDKKNQFGFLKNLSSGGCKIEIDGHQIINEITSLLGKLILIIIRLQGGKGTIFAIAKVAWYEQASGMDVFGYRFNIGMTFVKLLKNSRSVLSRTLGKNVTLS